jgi:hypothetical protein
MMTPIIQQDFRLVQGDGWQYYFPCTNVLTGAPIALNGYSAAFSLRRNYGDATALIAMTTSTPSANGSTIQIVAAPGSVSPLSAVLPTVTGADVMLLTPLVGQRTTKFYYGISISPPAGDPITIVAGAWYVWTRT